VHDPTDLLRVGDVIKYSAFTSAETAAREQIKTQLKREKLARMKEQGKLQGRAKKGDGKRSKRVRVRHVVRQVVTPFGIPLEERVGQEGRERKLGASIVARVQRGDVMDGVERPGDAVAA
jgi:hypothetical protein